MAESKVKSKAGFDWTKYQIKSETRPVTIQVGEDGDELTLGIRDLGYVQKNKLVSSCYTYAGGTVGFDMDTYMRETLKTMIVDAPWGATNDVFLMSINQDLGKALEELIPSAFDSDGVNATLKKD
jgi:acetamidase/formamidase